MLLSLASLYKFHPFGKEFYISFLYFYLYIYNKYYLITVNYFKN